MPARCSACDYQWTGSETSDVAQMVNAMNAAIAGKADAIAVCIVDPKGFDRPVENALAAGIPVFSYNADLAAANKRLAYIGQDLFLSGQMMGERIVKLVGSGKVAMFIATPGQLNLQPRVDGAMDAIKKSGANIQATMIATDPTANAGLSKIQAYYLGNQDVKGMFGVSGGDTMNCGLVSRQYNLPAKGVHAGGYDLLPKSLEAVHDGFLDFVIDQQPYLQGFYTVMEMFVFKVSGGLVGPADINTGLKFVTKDAVGPYLEHQDPLRRQRQGSADRAAQRPDRRLSARGRAERRQCWARGRGGRASWARPAGLWLPAAAGGERHRRFGGARHLFRARQPEFPDQRECADGVAVRRRAGDHRLRRDHAADLPRDRSVGRAGFRAGAVSDGERARFRRCRCRWRSSRRSPSAR